MPYHRSLRVVASLVAAAVVQALLAIVDPAPAAAVPASTSASGAPRVCAAETLDAQYAESGTQHRYGRRYVSAGTAVTFIASGAILPSRYVGSGRGEYKMFARVTDPDSGATVWEKWNFKATGIVSGPEPYPWQPFSGVNIGTWSNTGGAKAYGVEMWAERTYAGADLRWSIDIGESSCVGGRERLGGSNPAERNICTCSNADPVETATGNYWDTTTDLAVPGRGPGLGLTRTYNSAMAAVDGPFGWGTSFSYGMGLAVLPDGRVTISQENGSEVYFAPSGGTYTAPGRIQATLTHVGGTWTYVRGGLDTFVFEDSGRLWQIRDGNGYATTLAYDAGGHLATATDTAVRVLTFGWTGSRITSVTDPGSPAHAVTYAYDPVTGDLLDVTDVAGGVTHFTYAEHRRETTRHPRHAGLPSPPVLRNVYDSLGRVVSQTDRTGAITTFDFVAVPGATKVTDARGNVTHAYFDGGVMTKRIVGVNTAAPITTVFEHDANQAVKKITSTRPGDPNTHVVTFGYDVAGNRTSIDDGVHPPPIAVFNGLRLPTSVTDGAGTTTTLLWDSAGNLQSTSTPIVPNQGGPTTQSVVYHYDDAAHPGDVTSVTDPRGKTWTYGYDTYGVNNSLTEPGGPANKTSWAHNSIGWLTSVTTPRGNVSGAPAGSFTTTFSNFTNFGAWKSVTDAAGHVLTRDFDADWNVGWSQDATGKKTSYQYDAENRLVQVDRADGSPLKTTYWPDGNVKDQIDAANNTTTYDYDVIGSVASQQEPGGNCVAVPMPLCTKYGYDAVGNLISLKQPNNTTSPLTTTYGYDTASQLKTVTYSDGTTPNISDAAYDTAGRRTSLVAANGTSSWAWDSLGRMTSSSDPAGTVSYLYDAAGNLTQLTYPGGTNSVKRAFDDAGRLTSITDWLAHKTTFGTDPDGNLQSQSSFTADASGNPISPADGITTTTGVDPLGALTSISAARRAGGTVATMTYTRNAVEQVATESTTGLADPLTRFEYDAVDRLSAANNESYSYNAADRLTKLGATTQAIDGAGRLSSQTSPTYGAPKVFDYDYRGNRKTAGASTYGFDQANRLTTASVGPDFAGTVAATKPLGYWRLGEAVGNNYGADSSGTGHRGIYWGASTRDIVGGPTTTAGDDGAATFNANANMLVGRPGEMIPVTPKRILATSQGIGQQGALAPGGTRTIQVGGPSVGANVPGFGVSAVVVAITALSTASGSLTTYRADIARPPASTNTFTAAVAMNNQQTVALTDDTKFTIYNSAGSTHLWVDVVGYYSDGTFAGQGLTTVDPAHIYDTRSGVRFASGETRATPVSGQGGLPATGVGAVVLNVTVDQPAAWGWLNIYSSELTQPPSASAINFAAGKAVTNEVTVKVGTDGKVKITNGSTGAVDVVVDVIGWYAANAGSLYVPVTPTRRLDTRQANAELGPFGPGADKALQLAGTAGVPLAGIDAVLVNLTAVNPSVASYLLAYKDGASKPPASDLTVSAGVGIANEVMVPVSADGKIRISNFAGTTDVIVDVIGYLRTDPLFALNSGFTVEFFAKAIAGAGATTVVRTGTESGPDGWAVTTMADNRVKFTRNGSSITTVGTLSTAAWRHIAFTYSGGTVRAYLDGVPDPTPPLSVTYPSAKPQSYIGWGAGAVSIDEAAIYGRALSAGEIAAQKAAAAGTGFTTASYVYNPDGSRRSKTVNPPGGPAATTTFSSDQAEGLAMVLTETTGAAATSYVYGPGGVPIEAISSSGVVTYFVHDQLGSTRALTDVTGNVTATFGYDALGRRSSATGAATTPFGFAGQYTDAETGFQYLRARYYDPATGQFMSRDPLEALTRDAYGYAAGDPVNLSDPSGLAPWDGWGDAVRGAWNDFRCGLATLGQRFDTGLERLGAGLGEAARFVWAHREVIAFTAMLVGSVGTGGIFTVALYGGLALSTAATVDSCARGDRVDCALGIVSLVSVGAGRALQRAGDAMKAAGEARMALSRWHAVQRYLTGPMLRGAGVAAGRAGFWVGLASNIPSGVALYV